MGNFILISLLTWNTQEMSKISIKSAFYTTICKLNSKNKMINYWILICKLKRHFDLFSICFRQSKMLKSLFQHKNYIANKSFWYDEKLLKWHILSSYDITICIKRVFLYFYKWAQSELFITVNVVDR